jgi:Fur family ferric uptake transcriptional regulator
MGATAFDDNLRRHGLRVTAQRLAILDALAGLGGHSTVRQIHQAALRRHPDLHLATVYRTLDALRRAGLVDAFASSAGSHRFAPRDPKHPHAHLLCRACQQVNELPLDSLIPMAKRIQRHAGFQVDLRHLTLIGTCAGCRRPSGRRTGG